jgi:hypothetical protein
MAKSLARFSRPIIIHAPRSRGRFRRAASRAVGFARRGGRAVGRTAKRFPSIPVAIGGLAVGFADGSGYLDKLPAVAGSRMVTLGLIGFAATRYMRNPSIRAAGLAALGAAAYAVGVSQARKGGTAGHAAEGDGGAGEHGGY